MNTRQELDAGEDNLIYTEADLLLVSTEQVAITAQSLLTRNKSSASDQILALVKDDVQYLSITIASSPVSGT